MNAKALIPVALIGAAAAAYFFVWKPRHTLPADQLVASGTVEATDAALGFQVPGRLTEVLPREGDRVTPGQPLARLDAAEARARRGQAEAQVAVARAQLAELEAGSRREEVAAAKAGVDAAGQKVADAERDVARARQLFEGRAVAREVVDKSETGLEVARAGLQQAREQEKLLQRGARPERIEAARAAVAQAEAALAAADTVLGNLELAAPFAGIVTVRHREPGEIVPTGGAVFTLMNPDDRWVRIFVPENQLGKVSLGMAAAITADTFPGKTYNGRVAFIASEAEFTPKNVQTTEERVRLVYAVKVQIEGDAALELKPGLPADVRLATAPVDSAG